MRGDRVIPAIANGSPMVTEKTQALVEVQPYLRRLALGGTGGDIVQWHGVVRPYSRRVRRNVERLSRRRAT